MPDATTLPRRAVMLGASVMAVVPAAPPLIVYSWQTTESTPLPQGGVRVRLNIYCRADGEWWPGRTVIYKEGPPPHA